MLRRSKFAIVLLATHTLYLPVIGTINYASAAQDNIQQELHMFLQQNAHDTISGQITGTITEVIKAGNITYVEVDTGKTKVWSAGLSETPLQKGDTISFSTETAMQNFHSKALSRDFPVIYFVKQFITDKSSSITPAVSGQVEKHKPPHPVTTAKTGTPGEVEVGSLLRQASLDGLNTETRSLSDYKGKPLIINIWASWCGPCRAEMGSLDRLAKRYNGKIFNIIGISTDDYRDKAEAFIKQTDISFENYLDTELQLENMLGATTIPLTILVDAEGKVLEKVHGSREWDSPEIVSAIEQAFGIKLE